MISPIIANIFMEHLEERALESASKKPSLWLRYVDDTFTLWPHNQDSLDEFLHHLNSICPTIQFTMETESNNQLPFLDITVKRTGPNKIKTEIYRKQTHTDRYLNYRSYHPHHIKNGIINTLNHRAKAICKDQTSLAQETNHLRSVFRSNGYPDAMVNRIIQSTKNKSSVNKEELQQETKTIMTIPYVQGVSEKIKRVCYKEGIHVVFRSGKTLRSILTHVKPKPDDNNLPGVIYKIPCLDCNRSYIGETGRTLQVRIGEHKRHCRNLDTNKSAVAQHSLEEGHRID